MTLALVKLCRALLQALITTRHRVPAVEKLVRGVLLVPISGQSSNITCQGSLRLLARARISREPAQEALWSFPSACVSPSSA